MQSYFPLLSLPLLPLSAVIQCLSKEDKRSLACVCRSLAKSISDASKKSTVVVTPATGWESLCKVLDTCTITCNDMLVTGNATTRSHQPPWWCFWGSRPRRVARNTLDVLFQPIRELRHSFPGIKQLRIQARPLPCLLPVGVANLLPDLEKLIISCGPGQYAAGADLQPLPYCSTLRTLTIVGNGVQIQLPAKYHTVNDLQKQLPNIETLGLWASSTDASTDLHDPTNSTSTLLTAWGSQLTELLLGSEVAPAEIQHCTRLQSLFYPVESLWPFPTFLPQSLTSLHLTGSISEPNLQSILQLPSLGELSITRFDDSLQQDWSQHPCTWQRLKLQKLWMVDLSKLPLHSLRGEKCLEISYLVLPDPLLPDSLSKVEHAAHCVSNANITIGGMSCWRCDDEAWEVEEDFEVNAEDEEARERLQADIDTSLAKVLRAACRVVQPPESFSFKYLPVYPEITAQLLGWLSETVIELSIGKETEVPLWFWQAVQCCSKLTKIGAPLFMVKDQASEVLENVSSLAVQVSEHLVTVTNRPVTIVIISDFITMCEETDNNFLEYKIKLEEHLPQSVVLSQFGLSEDNLVETFGQFMISLQPVGCGNLSSPSAHLPDGTDGTSAIHIHS